MKQSAFINDNEALWQQIETWLNFQDLSRRERARLTKTDQHNVPASFDFPEAYRRLCHHLALAQSRMYSPLLIERLNRLVVRGHNRLYSHKFNIFKQILDFFLYGFPQLVRQEYRVVLFSTALFFLSFFLIFGAIQLYPELVYSVIDGEQVLEMEAMYNPKLTERLGRERQADTDVYMFGFYISHNTGIDFQTFAGGLLFGIGTLVVILFNGLNIGAVAGHLTHVGYTQTFWSFVAGHSAFELIAMFISGAAGFKLAEALIKPGQKSRLLALLDNSQIAIRLIYGAATMTIMAAFIEAFWSSQVIIPALVKYIVGILLWLLTISYFIWVGRFRTNTVRQVSA
ncbi:stage II sporulation protein M [Thiolinea disciformis]|uniref:stage II sporulation protein M n=1 Tax=Thiolinea disciformis TaxID=125614 RepID=UPI00036315F0|nr:stage II sporulation protein M [Thiolinea disciformis]